MGGLILVFTFFFHQQAEKAPTPQSYFIALNFIALKSKMNYVEYFNLFSVCFTET